MTLCRLLRLGWLLLLPGSLPLLAQTPGHLSPAESHQRMVETLAKIARRAANDNVYFGDRDVRQLKATLKQLQIQNPTVDAESSLLFRLGLAELRLGREQEAVEHCSRAAKLVADHSSSMPNRVKTHVAYWLAVCHMRLGETQNCCVRNTPDSCIFPITGEGIHTNQSGSKEAIRLLTLVLEKSPRELGYHDRAKWLLNIAYMTIGGYPDDVPEEYRIDASRLDTGQKDTDQPFPRFRNVAQTRGVATFSTSGGVIADDFDNDGWIDLMVSTYEPDGQLRYFHNCGDGTFEDRTTAANLEGITGGLNMIQADFNNDGFVDLFVMRGGWWGDAGKHPNSLLRNNGDGTFVDVTFAAGLADENFPTQTASWADYDLDGDLDLYVGNEHSAKTTAPSQLFRNNGDGTFRDVAEAAGVTNLRYAKSVIWGDFDQDRWPDLHVSNFLGQNRLYHNHGDGTFSDVAVALGVAEPEASFPAWFWDADNDGQLDLFVSGYSAHVADLLADNLDQPFRAELPRLYQFENGTFTDQGRRWNLSQPSAPMGSNFGDLDNDGFLDFYLGTGWPEYDELMPNMMFRNEQGQSFANVTVRGGFGHLQKGHAVAFADFDQDGDLDVFQQMGGAFPGDRFHDALYENPGFENHWIAVTLIGTDSNRSAIGTRIHVVVADDSGSRSIYRWVNSGATFGASPLRQQIGLGRSSSVERLEIYWPKTDKTQVFTDVPVDRRYEVREGQDELRTP